MNDQKVKYILDSDVDEALNKKLIDILSVCFPDQEIFTKQRFYKEKPNCRWIIENETEIIAHVALHKKEIIAAPNKMNIGGIAEVCVRPEYRGKGFVKLLLTYAHDYLIENGFKFSMLLGDANVYSSSGYKIIDNEIKYYDHIAKVWKIEKIDDVMIKELSDEEWPNGLIDIQGPTF